MLYIGSNFKVAYLHILQDMNYFLVLIFGQVTSGGQTDGRTESDAYEPIVRMHRCAQKSGWSPHVVGEGALSSEVTLGYPRDSPDRASAPRARGGAAMGKSGPHPYGLDPQI